MKNKLKILYHMPFPETVNAYRTIYEGYKNAFIDKGHKFYTLTTEDNLKEKLKKIKPDIFITTSHFYYRKYLDFKIMEKYRKKGMVVFVKIGFWNSPFGKKAITEAKSLKEDHKVLELIKNNLLGDIFFQVVEQNDQRMKGFKKGTGKKWHTIPLAADKRNIYYDFEKKYEANISFIGTNLPEKKIVFKELLFPLKKYGLALYGQDWDFIDKLRGFIQKGAEYLNLKSLKKIRKPKLNLNDERKIYSSSKICVNIHSDHQRTNGGDCNERTFKIPLCRGFEITDNIKCIKKYFIEGEEIIIAKNTKDWYKKVEYYLNHPKERKRISENGHKKVIKYHTYHNRIDQIIKLYNKFIMKNEK
jgi:spore maturation protein CgeB